MINFIISREFITFLSIIVLLVIIILIFIRKKLSNIAIESYITILIVIVSCILFLTHFIER